MFEKDYFVLDFSKDAQEVIKLISASCGVSVEEMLLKAVQSFDKTSLKDTMPCPYCKQELVRKPFSTKRIIKVGNTFEITIRNVPFFKCQPCNHEFQDVLVDYYLDFILNRKVQSLLIKGDEVPLKMEFEELTDLTPFMEK